MRDLRQRLLAVFGIECKEHLERIRAILESSGIATRGPDLDEVFRRAHSLKGASRAVDMREIEAVAHRLETLFSRVRDGSLFLDPRAIQAVYQGLDAIEDGAADPNATSDRTADAVAAIENLLEGRIAPPPGHGRGAGPCSARISGGVGAAGG